VPFPDYGGGDLVAHLVGFAAPKTSTGRRHIALSASTVEVLRAHRAGQLEERLALGPAWQDHDLVFPNTYGGPLQRSNLDTASFFPLMRKAGVPRIRFHDLRHTAATLLLGESEHPKVASEMLGHASVMITLDLYSHVQPNMQREAARKMERLLGR
jgi:integrase